MSPKNERPGTSKPQDAGGRGIESLRQWLKQFDLLSGEQFAALVPGPIINDASTVESWTSEDNDPWTIHDEFRLLECWHTDDDFRKLLVCPFRDLKRDLLPYRIITLLFGCLPEDILSIRNNLDYDAFDLFGEGRDAYSYMEDFARIAIHPIFYGDPRRLSIAIQYAVICRTNDERKWPLMNPPVPEPDRFLLTLWRLIDEDKSHTPPVALRKEAQAFWLLQPVPTSPWSMLFEAIEKIAHNESRGPRNTGDKLYSVTGRDLEVIQAALTNLSKTPETWREDWNRWWRLQPRALMEERCYNDFGAAMPDGVHPTSEKELREVMLRVALWRRREEEMKKPSVMRCLEGAGWRELW